jgi:hypothetical protein
MTVILIREFQTSDEEMKEIMLKVVKQCAATEGVTPAYIKWDILPDFFKSFWVRRMALDRHNYKQVVEMMVKLVPKAGASEVIGRVVNEPQVIRSIENGVVPGNRTLPTVLHSHDALSYAHRPAAPIPIRPSLFFIVTLRPAQLTAVQDTVQTP